MCTVKCSNFHIRLNRGVREDLSYLCSACDQFNGTVVLMFGSPLPEIVVSTDACLTVGAAYYQGDWFYVNWDIDYPEWSNLHINLKELVTVLLALRKWRELWRNKFVVIYTDSMVTKYVLTKGSMKNDIGMDFLREIFYILASDNINIIAKHLISKDNIVADALSRLDSEDFALVAAELLLNSDDLILHPSYDWQKHMSHECAFYISQTLFSLKKDIWLEMSTITDNPYSPNLQKLPTGVT